MSWTALFVVLSKSSKGSFLVAKEFMIALMASSETAASNSSIRDSSTCTTTKFLYEPHGFILDKLPIICAEELSSGIRPEEHKVYISAQWMGGSVRKRATGVSMHIC